MYAIGTTCVTHATAHLSAFFRIVALKRNLLHFDHVHDALVLTASRYIVNALCNA